ncbi:MAG: uL13 family ribosomal protein, partial [Candidatus Aenigmatarchaeota archaeon]
AIVNAERAVVSGRKETVFARYLERRQRGSPEHGPFFPRTPERIVRRAVRGMIGYKSPGGKLAYGRVKAYVGVPEAIDKSKIEKPSKAAKALSCDFVYVGEISKYLGYDYGR